jgi:hypothetical protein
MRETSDAMPDPRLATIRPADFAQEADGQCRGIGPSGTPERSSGRGRGGLGLGGSPNTPADVPVARPVVREADGYAERSAITKAATEAVRRDAADRAALQRAPVATRDATSSTRASSADLIGLLEHLRTVVARYVCDRRVAGAPIERVLPEVKALVREAVAYEGWHDAAEALMRQVVGWTIAAYYDAPGPAQAGVHVAGRR